MLDNAEYFKEIIAPIGEEQKIRPGNDISLTSSDVGWFVKEGSLKLFFTDSSEFKKGSTRFFLLDIEQGEYFYGIGPCFGQAGFFATTSVPTVLLQFNNKLVFSDQQFRKHLPHTLKLNHDWNTKINGLLFNKPQPKKKHINLEDEPEEISKGLILKPASGEMLGIESLTGEWRYCSEEISCSEVPFLLTPGTWLESAEENSGYKKFDDIHKISGELCFESIGNCRNYLRKYSETAIRDKIESEKTRLKNRSSSAENAFSESIIGLSKVMDDDGDPGGPDVSSQPLIKCISLIASQSGFEVNINDQSLDFKQESSDLVKDVAKSSRFRVRKVILRDNWWEQDNGLLLVFKGEEKTPATLIPQKAATYKIYDPISEEMEFLNQDIINDLDPAAFSFIRPFKDVVLTPFEIFKFGVVGLRNDIFRILLAAIALQILTLSIPVFTGQFMDSIIPHADRIQWLHVTVVLVVVGICTALFNLVQWIAMLRMESQMNIAIQSATTDRLLKLPIRFFRNYTVGDLADRLLGVNEIRQLASGVTFKACLSGITGFISFPLLFYYSPKLSLVAVGFALLAGIINVILGKKALGYNRKVFFIRGKISGQLLQFLSGITRLHVSAIESKAFSVWSKLFIKQKKWDFRAKQIENFIAMSQAIYPVLSTLIIFTLYVFWLLPGGDVLTIGAFIAFTSTFSTFLTGNLTMAMAGVESLEIVPLYERVKPIFETETESSFGAVHPGNLKGEIELSNVSFRYSEDSPYIMDNISLSIKIREYIAFVGPSGSGKSTILRLLLGFEKPESGSIYFDGKDLQKLDIEKVRSQIGVVLQTSQLISGSIFENIVGSSKKYTLDDAWDAAELAGLKSDIKAMPMGMHTVVNEGGTTFSGGQRQRLMIARAIVSKPRIILFDEATSALDNKTQEIVKSSLDSISATKIVIAHRLSTIIDADRIMVIADGGIAQEGSYDELISQDGIFADLSQRQLI